MEGSQLLTTALEPKGAALPDGDALEYVPVNLNREPKAMQEPKETNRELLTAPEALKRDRELLTMAFQHNGATLQDGNAGGWRADPGAFRRWALQAAEEPNVRDTE